MTPDDIVPGDLITPPCQGKVRRQRCAWPRTAFYHGLWLCSVCVITFNIRLALRRAAATQAKLNAKARRATKRKGLIAMPLQIAFWMLMVIWVAVHFIFYRIETAPTRASYAVIFGLVWVLLFMLGWKTFGFVIQG